jgi:hypothetical protein
MTKHFRKQSLEDQLNREIILKCILRGVNVKHGVWY